MADPLLVPNFGTMSRIRDIWLKCPYFVPNLEYFGLKIGILVIFIHFCTPFFLFVKLQSKVQSLGLGVDFVFPLSEQQEQEEQEEQEPPPKYTRMKHPRSLKFDT